MQSKNTIRVTRITAVIFSLLLITAMAVFALLYSLTSEGDKPTLTKDEIRENIISVTESKKDYRYAAYYLSEYGIPSFDASKFKSAESFFETRSVYEQKPKEELALKTAELFLEYYFDTTDLGDKTLVTDKLLTCFAEATGDKYAVYRTAGQYEEYNTDMSGSFVGIGVYVKYSEQDNTVIVSSVMENSAALDAGVLAGDCLYAVDGKTLAELGYDAFINAIRGEVGTSVALTVIRGGEYIDLTAVRKQITEKSVSYSIDGEKIGKVKITGFKQNTAEQFREAIDALEAAGAVGIIFDLRDNPGGYLQTTVDVIDYLVPVGTRIASAKRISGEDTYTAKNEHFITVPITVIFNDATASGGELFSAAMRDYAAMGILKCTTVGTNTYSKGVMQNTGTFGDGSTLTLTVGYYNPPSNVNYDGIGVAPDVEVKWSAEGDPQLDAAYAEIKKLIEQK